MQGNILHAHTTDKVVSEIFSTIGDSFEYHLMPLWYLVKFLLIANVQ